MRQSQRKFKVLALESFDDLLQECLAHWFFNKDQCSTDKASLRTFLNRVIRHKLLDLVRKRKAVIRQAFFESIPLDEIINSENFKTETFLMVYDDELEKPSRDEFVQTLSNAMSRLSKRQKILCQLLGEEGLSQSEAAQRMKIPRTTLRDEIERIRGVFREEGLENFLSR